MDSMTHAHEPKHANCATKLMYFINLKYQTPYGRGPWSGVAFLHQEGNGVRVCLEMVQRMRVYALIRRAPGI